MMSTNEKLFKFWVEQGWKVRLKNNPYIAENLQEYKTRLRHEYQVITSMQDYGFVDYFLMVSDLVRWAKNQGILVGPGRGSGAGSLICWLLGITEVDPMLYPMLFERFISIDRPDLPDLDIDFEDERRGEVIAYSQQKYGYDKVANILNFVRYKGKNSLDDVARVYHIPGWKIDSIKDKLVERSEGHARFADTLQDTFDSNPEIELLVEETPELKFATQLEGNYRNSSIHPAGIVISSVPLSNVCATYEKQSGTERGSGVAYDKKDGAYLGLLKVDFLSLTTLTGIRASLDAIGMSIAEYYRLTLDDPKVYEAFRQGDVLGIFQFEGHATKRVLKAVAPTKFMDLVDVNALSRPGGDDQAYVAAKNSGQPSWLSTVHENVARHVDWTHGTIVYQEQILLILRDLGNFPPADVNSVRKIISDKQDSTVFNEYLQRFVDGAATHGVSAADATRVWEGMVSATGYAFNISHAVCYSDTAYRQMWLKVYHPEFYLGQLMKCPSDKPGEDRRRKLIVEAMNRGIKVEPPNLNYSYEGWTLSKENNTLYAGFTAIKGVGPKMAANIVDWREAVGTDKAWLDWDDLLAVPGIGPGRVDTMRNFAESDDPFGVNAVGRVLSNVRNAFRNGEFGGIDPPTHQAKDLSTPDEFVVFVGVLKGKIYRDTLEQKLKYGAAGVTAEEILALLPDPHLLKHVALVCEDETDEPIRVRIGRKLYPRYEEMVKSAKVDRDVVLVKGWVSDYGGIAIQAKEVYLINPEGL